MIGSVEFLLHRAEPRGPTTARPDRRARRRGKGRRGGGGPGQAPREAGSGGGTSQSRRGVTCRSPSIRRRRPARLALWTVPAQGPHPLPPNSLGRPPFGRATVNRDGNRWSLAGILPEKPQSSGAHLLVAAVRERPGARVIRVRRSRARGQRRREGLDDDAGQLVSRARRLQGGSATCPSSPRRVAGRKSARSRGEEMVGEVAVADAGPQPVKPG